MGSLKFSEKEKDATIIQKDFVIPFQLKTKFLSLKVKACTPDYIECEF